MVNSVRGLPDMLHAGEDPGVDIHVVHGTQLDVATALDSLHPRLHALEPRLVPAHVVSHVRELLLDVVKPLPDVHETLADVVREPVELIRERSDRLGDGCVLLSGRRRWRPGVVVVSGLLDSEAPLVAKLDLADGLGAPGTVDLPRRGRPLLGRAVVFHATAVTDEVVPRGLAVAVVGGSQLDDAIPVVLSPPLHRAQQVLERAEDALGRRQQC